MCDDGFKAIHVNVKDDLSKNIITVGKYGPETGVRIGVVRSLCWN